MVRITKTHNNCCNHGDRILLITSDEKNEMDIYMDLENTPNYHIPVGVKFDVIFFCFEENLLILDRTDL